MGVIGQGWKISPTCSRLEDVFIELTEGEKKEEEADDQ